MKKVFQCKHFKGGFLNCCFPYFKGVVKMLSRLSLRWSSQHNLILALLLRHIFFLHIKEALLAGHLQCPQEQAVELSALLAQTRFGDYNQNTAKYSYEELCAKELSSAALNRWARMQLRLVFMPVDLGNVYAFPEEKEPMVCVDNLWGERRDSCPI